MASQTPLLKPSSTPQHASNPTFTRERFPTARTQSSKQDATSDASSRTKTSKPHQCANHETNMAEKKSKRSKRCASLAWLILRNPSSAPWCQQHATPRSLPAKPHKTHRNPRNRHLDRVCDTQHQRAPTRNSSTSHAETRDHHRNAPNAAIATSDDSHPSCGRTARHRTSDPRNATQRTLPYTSPRNCPGNDSEYSCHTAYGACSFSYSYHRYSPDWSCPVPVSSPSSPIVIKTSPCSRRRFAVSLFAYLRLAAFLRHDS